MEFSKRAPGSFGDLAYEILTSGTSINPDGMETTDVQTLNITDQGLCTSPQQAAQDKYMNNYRYISNFTTDGVRTDVPATMTEKFRQSEADAELKGLGQTRCSRYIVSPDGVSLQEDVFIDGVKQPGSNVIHLGDASETLTLRPR
jgi:hypothetical protein